MGTPAAEEDEEGASSHHEQRERHLPDLRPRKRNAAAAPQPGQPEPPEAAAEEDGRARSTERGGEGATGKKKKKLLRRRRRVTGVEEADGDGGEEESPSSSSGLSHHEEGGASSSSSGLLPSVRRKRGSRKEASSLEKEQKGGVLAAESVVTLTGRVRTFCSSSSSRLPPPPDRAFSRSGSSRSPGLSCGRSSDSLDVVLRSRWRVLLFLVLFLLLLLLSGAFLFRASPSSSLPQTAPTYCAMSWELPAELRKEAADHDIDLSAKSTNSASEDCVPCPVHAVCSNGKMRCLPPYIRVVASGSHAHSLFHWLFETVRAAQWLSSLRQKYGDDFGTAASSPGEKDEAKLGGVRDNFFVMEECIEDADAKLEAQHVTEKIVDFLRAKAGEAQCGKIIADFFSLSSPWSSSFSPSSSEEDDRLSDCEEEHAETKMALSFFPSSALLDEASEGSKGIPHHPHMFSDISSRARCSRKHEETFQGKKSSSWGGWSLLSSPLHALLPSSSAQGSGNDAGVSKKDDVRSHRNFSFGSRPGDERREEMKSEALLGGRESPEGPNNSTALRAPESHLDGAALLLSSSSSTLGGHSLQDEVTRRGQVARPGSVTRWQLLSQVPGIEQALENDNVYAFTFEHFLGERQALRSYSVLMLSIISQVEQNYSFQPLQWGEASSGGDRQTARSAAAAGSPVLRPETSSIRLFLREQRRSKGITYTYTYTGARALRPWPCTVYLIVICQLVPSVLVVLTVLLLLFPFACWMRRVYLRRRLRAILIAQHRLHASESFSLQHTSLAAAIYPGTSTIDLAHLLVREVLLFRRRCIGVLPSWWLCRLARDVDEVDTLCHDLLLDTSIRVHTARLDDQNFWWIEETDNQIAAPSPIRQIQQTAEDIASSPGAGGACSPLQPPSPGMDEAMEYSNAQRDLLMQLANEPRDRLSPLAGSVSVPGASYFLGNENAFNQYGEPRYSLHGNPFHSQGDSLLRRSSAHESARRLAESMNPGTAALHGSRAPTGWQTGGLDPPYGGIEPCQVPVGGGNRKSFFAVGDTPCEGLTRTSRLPTLMERASNIASQGLLNARTSAGGTRVAPKRGSSLVAGVKDYSHAAFLALADRHAGERQSVVAGREAGSGVKQKVYSTVEPYAHDSWRASTRGFLGAVPGDGNTRASRSAGRRATGYVGSFIGMGNSGAN